MIGGRLHDSDGPERSPAQSGRLPRFAAGLSVQIRSSCGEGILAVKALAESCYPAQKVKARF